MVVFFILAALICAVAAALAAVGVTVRPELVVIWPVFLLLMVICRSDLVFEVVVEAEGDEYDGVAGATAVRDCDTELDGEVEAEVIFRFAFAPWLGTTVGVAAYCSDSLFWAFASC